MARIDWKPKRLISLNFGEEKSNLFSKKDMKTDLIIFLQYVVTEL